ncbi:MAG: hypothetical protein A3F77_10945 [Betaproteobacteria bacterium RIFCSPLOWO2_12_FULL_67_28]|nr:MAG: hypothetical protein A3F77_10945 [Betaproteobacteria bacterium RIFCSPLOWO2_12_FULL_67_28]
MTIADYCAAMNRREIVTNSNYQRSDKVWPPAARSYLIESILLGYPIPKIFLFQKTDLKSKKTIKEIVDGQQRSKTIHDFFSSKLAISSKSKVEAAAGKKYEQLDDDLKGAFLNYQLSVDLFLAATPREIRESFRRLNSYTVPLNPEEKRHAEYQGEYKWFAHELTSDYEESFLEMGVFGQKQIVRMQDTKLVTEITHALLYGIKTTKSKQLDDVYEENDDEFAQRKMMEKRITKALDWLVNIDDIHNGPLMAPHIFYTLVLAVSHAQNPSDKLQDAFELEDAVDIDDDVAASNLSTLANALEADPSPKKFKSFVDASAEKTNVEDQRKSRFEWLCRALTSNAL